MTQLLILLLIGAANVALGYWLVRFRSRRESPRYDRPGGSS